MYLKKVVQKNWGGSSRTYLQFVESVRTENGPRQNILANLGRIDNKEGKEKLEILASSIIKIAETLELLDFEKDIKAEWAKEMGPNLIFRRLFEKLNIDKIIDQTITEETRTEFDVKDSLFNLMLNRLTEPCSKHNMTNWQKEQYGVEEHNLQHYYRSMDHLYDNKEQLEDLIFKNMKTHSSDRENRVNFALFDTTTLVYYGDGDEEESLLNYGFSKARRSDLKQIVVGLALTSDGIPLSHDVYSGNTNDVTCFKNIIDKFVDKHREKNITFIGDRGMISNKNMEHLEQSGYSYILGFRMRTIKKDERAEVLNKANLNKIKKTLEFKNIEYKGRRLIVYFNPERAEIEAAKREEILNRIKDKIKNGKIESIIENKDYKRFLKIEGKAPILDKEKIDKDSLFDGIFILTTNTNMSAREVVQNYRSLWMCEFSFRTLKSELEMGPIYHWKNRRIVSHIFICFLALILRVMLTKELKRLSKDISYIDVLRDLKALYATKIKVKSVEVVTRTEIRDNAKMAFKAIGMAFPTRVLSHQSSKHIVIEK